MTSDDRSIAGNDTSRIVGFFEMAAGRSAERAFPTIREIAKARARRYALFAKTFRLVVGPATLQAYEQAHETGFAQARGKYVTV